jgi:hypothetical protein
MALGALSICVALAPVAGHAQAMVPAGAEISLNLDGSDITDAQFIQKPNGEEEILSIGASLRYWRLDKENMSPQLPHSSDPVYEDKEDRSEYYRQIFCVSPDGIYITSGGYSGFIERNKDDGKFLFGSGSILEGISSVSYSKDGKLLMLSGSGSVSLWDVRRRLKFKTLEDGTDLFYSAFDNSGEYVATTSLERFTVNLWEIKTGRLLRTYRIPGHAENSDSDAGLSILRFSHDNSLLFSAETDREILHVWNVAKSEEFKRFSVGGISTYIVSKDGKNIIVGLKNGDVNIIDVDSEKITMTVRTGRGPITSLSESKRSDLLLVTESGHFDVIDTNSGKIIAILFDSDNHGVAYTPKGIFVTDGDPHKAFKIIWGNEELPIEDFIRLNRRATLIDAIKGSP